MSKMRLLGLSFAAVVCVEIWRLDRMLEERQNGLENLG